MRRDHCCLFFAHRSFKNELIVPVPLEKANGKQCKLSEKRGERKTERDLYPHFSLKQQRGRKERREQVCSDIHRYR